MIRPSLALFCLLSSLAAPSVLAAPVDARVSYVVTVGGINVALVDIDLNDDGQRYALDLSASVTGLGSVVARGTARSSASGISTGPALQSENFTIETVANGETFAVDVGFSNRNVTSFQVQPPVYETSDRVALERSHLTGVGDFLSAFVLKGDALDRNLCQRNFKIFTGVERFDIRMGFLAPDEATSPRTGYQGPLVACSIKYEPISGHFRSSEMITYLADISRMVIWYAPLGQTGYYIPYRVILGTSMGDLSIVLTHARS